MTRIRSLTEHESNHVITTFITRSQEQVAASTESEFNGPECDHVTHDVDV